MTNWSASYYTTTEAMRVAYEACLDGRESSQEAWKAFGDRFGTTGVFSTDGCLGGRIAGLKFEADAVPPGWIHRQKDPVGCYYPTHKTAAGKKLRKEMDALPIRPNLSTLTTETMKGHPNLSWSWGFLKGDGSGRTMPANFEPLGDELVLHIPHGEGIDTPPAPPGCELIKRSAYWAMKEAQDAAA